MIHRRLRVVVFCKPPRVPVSGLAPLVAGCASPGPAAGGGDRKRLRAAMGNAGLQSTWCKLGKDTAELWGDLLGVEVVWFDGEFDPQKQRNKLDLMVDGEWDFCCFQAVQIDSLEEPVRQLKKRGVPVISMDTMLVAKDRMRDVGVWCEVTPNQAFMGESSTRYLMQKIGGARQSDSHRRAERSFGRTRAARGFEKALADYPEVEVVGGGVRWCDWEKQTARDTFETLLDQSRAPIAGAFFHSDDMALACLPALEGTISCQDGRDRGGTDKRKAWPRFATASWPRRQ